VKPYKTFHLFEPLGELEKFRRNGIDLAKTNYSRGVFVTF